MSEHQFLLARIHLKDIDRACLDWVAGAKDPYRAVDPVDLDEEVLDQVYEMYADAYGAIDERLNISSRDGLFEYNRWILIEAETGGLVGFVLLKTTAFGLKTGVTASDGSSVGKQAIVQFHRRVYSVEEVFAEVSNPLERIIREHVPWVSFDVAEMVMHPKSLKKDSDGYHYRRNIKAVGPRKKLMVGKPKLPPK